MLTNAQKTHRAANSSMPCSLSGCSGFRAASSQYCENHSRRQEAYGHVKGRLITVQELHNSRKTVRRFFRDNHDHPAVLAAVELLEKWMQSGAMLANDMEAEKSLQELRRLVDGGVSGMEALEVLSAVWLYSHDRPNHLPDDARLTFALSRAFLMLRPQRVKGYGYCSRQQRSKPVYSKPGARIHQSIGAYIRSGLGLFFVNLISGIEAERANTQNLKADLAKPFAGNGLEIPKPTTNNKETNNNGR